MNDLFIVFETKYSYFLNRMGGFLINHQQKFPSPPEAAKMGI